MLSSSAAAAMGVPPTTSSTAPALAAAADGGDAAAAAVPTLPDEVRAALRKLGEPVRLFGENPMNVRERLRQVLLGGAGGEGGGEQQQRRDAQQQQQQEQQQQTTTEYTRGSAALVQARQEICRYSLSKARSRLERERRLRREATLEAAKRKRKSSHLLPDDDCGGDGKKPSAENDADGDNLPSLDGNCRRAYASVRAAALEASQYGDRRALSSLRCTTASRGGGGGGGDEGIPVAVTASWTASVHVWNLNELSVPGTDNGEDALLPPLSGVGQKAQCHEDRIMGLAVHHHADTGNTLIATTSLDTTAKLWSLSASTSAASDAAEGSASAATKDSNSSGSNLFRIEEEHCLTGHSARTCRAAFHPSGQFLATTSADHTWRFWDVEAGDCLLLQDGHADVAYGVDFHPDGGLIATTDWAGVVHAWDLRTGQSVWTCFGHAGRVLNAAFHPSNGFQLATAGDDGTIQVWDLRRRRPKQQRQQQQQQFLNTGAAVSIPAHNHLITNLRFETSSSAFGGGEILASSSFDGTVKLWGCRSWKLLNELHGHQGKVTSVDFLSDHASSGKSKRSGLGIVTCGFDKTVKLWK